MADEGRGTWNNVHKTPIVVDDLGRRRRDNGDVEKFPAVKDDPVGALRAELAALKTAFEAYKVQNDARTITGGGSQFSGTLGAGITFNPNAGGMRGMGADTYSITLCDGVVLVVYVESITPP